MSWLPVLVSFERCTWPNDLEFDMSTIDKKLKNIQTASKLDAAKGFPHFAARMLAFHPLQIVIVQHCAIETEVVTSKRQQ